MWRIFRRKGAFSGTAAYLIAWVGLSLFMTEIFRPDRGNIIGDISLSLVVLLFSIFPFWITARWLIPHLLFQRKYLWLILNTIAVILISGILTLSASKLVINFYYPDIPVVPPIGELIVNFNIFNWHVILCIFLSAAITLFFDRQKIELDLLVASEQRDQAEINMLRSQYNPAFMISVLDTLQENISDESEEVRNTVNSFRQMMNYQLYECNRDMIELYKEANYIKNYMDVQSARLERGVKVSFQVKGDINSGYIAPLLLLPLVENAFKHLSNYKEAEKNVIDLRITRKDQDQLEIIIFNTYEENVKNKYLINKGGLGLDNVRQRLELLYGGLFTFDTEEVGGIYTVRLTLRGIHSLTYRNTIV